MATRKKKTEQSKKATPKPESLTIANGGVKTGTDFANLMSGLMADLITGRVTPQVGNAVCNAGGKLLKIVEMKYKYGTPADRNNDQPDLMLTDKGK